jgi:lipopolysaccharide biosynthesis glycosyltransferase
VRRTGTINRVLYLDPDLIVNGSLKELYDLPMEEYYFAAASHTGPIIRKVNGLRLDMDDDSPYINSGVMLMNLKLLREEQDYDEVFRFIEKRKNFLILPDQDIISSLYGSRIYALDTYRYNMTERLYRLHSHFEKRLTLDWIRKHSVIIHYCGRNKPWNENYFGSLDVFYKEAVERMKNRELYKV